MNPITSSPTIMKPLLLSLLLLAFLPLHAQKAIIGRHDSVPRLILVKDVELTNLYDQQFSLSCVDKATDIPIVLTPENDLGYQLSNKEVYATRTFWYKGQTQTLFLRRDHIFNDSLAFYIYYDHKPEPAKKLKPIYLVQFAQDSILYPLIDDPAYDYVCPFRTWIFGLPKAQDPEVRQFFEQMQSTPRSFEAHYRIATSRADIRVPRFRWGVQLGLSYSQMTHEPFDLDGSLSLVPGLFADIPLSYMFSYHPEITFEKYASEGRTDITTSSLNSAAYNVTAISSPQLIRFTYALMPGKFLPYAELGAQASLRVKHTLDYMYLSQWYFEPEFRGEYLKQEFGSESVPAFCYGLLAGVGAEWLFAHRHSFFISARFFYEPGDISRMGGLLNISYNL